MISVIKFDGRRQDFQKEKIVRTCLRMHANHRQAIEIANKIERKAYDGITTKEILRLIFSYLKEYRPEVKHQIDLREAISLLRPKPDFESFVQILLREIGYDVIPNQILRGRCVEHEIDGIAKKNDKTILVEVKHHLNHHAYTGIDVCLVAQARTEDLVDGFHSDSNKIKFDKIMIVCNTKFSDQAKQYADCKDIELIGWRMPFDHGLEQIIEEKRLYPITFLKGLDRETEEKLGNSGIVLLKQLIRFDANELRKVTGIQIKKLRNLVESAKDILSSNK